MASNTQIFKRQRTDIKDDPIAISNSDEIKKSFLPPMFKHKTPISSNRSYHLNTKKSKIFSCLGKDSLVSDKEISEKIGNLKCLVYKPRKMTENKEILVFNVEGVLATLQKQFENNKIVIRSDMTKTLRLLQNSYQLVLISKWKTKDVLLLLTYCLKKSIYISGAYKLDERDAAFNNKTHDWYLDYSQIYNDFSVSDDNTQKIIILCPLLISPSELPFPHNIMEYTGTINSTFHVQSAPIPTKENPFTPITLCLPHMNLPPTIGLYSILEILQSLTHMSQTLTAFSSIKNITAVHSDNLNKELLYKYYPPSANEVRKIQKDRRSFRVNQKLLEVTKSFFLIVTGGVLCKTKVISNTKLASVLGYESLLEVSLQNV